MCARTFRDSSFSPRRDRRRTRTASLVLLLFCAPLPFAACTVNEALGPIEPTPFIEYPDLLRTPKQTPFSLAWVQPEVRGWQYDVLFVEAVRTNQVKGKNWIYSASVFLPTRRRYEHEVAELAEYIQRTVSEAFRTYEKKSSALKVEEGAPLQPLPYELPQSLAVPSPTPHDIEPIDRPERVLILSLSISEVDFGDPLIYGGLTVVPVPGAANLSTAVKSPALTLEARFIDKATGRVVAELVDRRFPQVKPIDINRLTVSSAVHELADSFAADLVASFFREHGKKVRGRFPFSLIPW